ncbi:hypothetical protein ABPG72_018984 [Tetrahymena utriculariae]
MSINQFNKKLKQYKDFTQQEVVVLSFCDSDDVDLFSICCDLEKCQNLRSLDIGLSNKKSKSFRSSRIIWIKCSPYKMQKPQNFEFGFKLQLNHRSRSQCYGLVFTKMQEYRKFKTLSKLLQNNILGCIQFNLSFSQSQKHKNINDLTLTKQNQIF